MSLQRRSRTVWIRRFVSQCRDIRREVEARVRMTVCLQPDLEQAATDLILKEDYGYMVGIKNGNIRKVPLGEVAGKLKMVDPKADIIKEAKIVGISFGDE